MAPAQHSTKPKLGNAALLFQDDSPNTHRSPLEGLPATRWIGQGLAIVLLMVVGSIIINQLPEPSLPVATVDLSDTPMTEHIRLVRADGANDRLIGTLVHNQHLPNSFAIDSSSKPISLTPEERERLLHIISSH